MSTTDVAWFGGMVAGALSVLVGSLLAHWLGD